MISHNAIVLVVDDQDSGRFVKAQLLRRAGYTVYEAGTGRETLDMARSASIDLVVLDVNLPDINGFELISFIRKNPAHKSTPVIVVSSEASDTNRQRSLALGANAYVSKPFEPAELKAAVEKHLKK